MSVGALYAPASSVVSVRATPLSVSKTVTMAPEMTPPLWSVTVPRIRPKLPCENAGRQSKSTANSPPSNCTAFLVHAPQHFLLIAVTEFISGPPVQRLSNESLLNLAPYPTHNQVPNA